MLVDPDRVAVRADDAAGGGDAVHDALGEAELVFELRDHGAEILGQGGQLETEFSGKRGLEVAGGDFSGEVHDGVKRPYDHHPVEDHDQAGDHGQHSDAEDDEHVALPGGQPGHLRFRGGHAHEPARLRHLGHGHVLFLALEQIVQDAVLERQDPLGDAFVNKAAQQQGLVHGMGDDPSVRVQHVAVACLAEADGVDELLGEVFPGGAHDGQAEGFARVVHHGVSDHEEQRARGFPFENRFGGVFLLAAHDGLEILAVGVACGQGVPGFGHAGHGLAVGGDEHGRGEIVGIGHVFVEHGLGAHGVAGQGLLGDAQVGQVRRRILGVFDEKLEHAGRALGRLRQGLLLERRGNGEGGGGRVDDQRGDADKKRNEDGKGQDGIDAHLTHEGSP